MDVDLFGKAPDVFKNFYRNSNTNVIKTSSAYRSIDILEPVPYLFLDYSYKEVHGTLYDSGEVIQGDVV